MAPVEFGILGPLAVLRAGATVPLGYRRDRRVLAALLLDANRLVPLLRLIDAVWDDDPPPSAAKAVRNSVSALRARLGEEDGGAIVTHPAGYVLRVPEDRLDAAVFDRRVARARRLAAAGERRPAVDELRAALALWRGPALAGVDGRMIEAAATGLNERRLGALEECVAIELSLGRERDLVEELTALVAEYPLRERLRGQLMLALYRAGRRSDALMVYRAGHRALVDELGLEPGPELRALAQAVVNDEPVLAEPGPGGPLGRCVPAQLPADASTFVGREPELRRLDDLLAGREHSPEQSVVAITGTPGVGKTTLAVHWAHRVRPRFPDGQLYADLRGYANASPKRPIEVLGGFLQSLGVMPDQIPADVDSAAGLYRTLLADRRMLVVLDNACGTDQVRPLLPGGRDCLVLVTGRDRLTGLVARENARLITLDVLTASEAGQLLTSTLGEDRTRAEPEAAAALAQLCAGLPLALRISAANLVGQPRRSIADQVSMLGHGNRLAALQADDDDQAAVRAAFDQSYAALAPEAKRLFRRLGLVPGRDLATESVAALADMSEAEAARVLDRLAAAHLVHRGAGDRVAFHDLLRTYAAQRARAEDSAPVRLAALDRLYARYLGRVVEAARLLYPQMLRLTEADPEPAAAPTFTDPPSALGWLDAERANLVGAVLHAAEVGLTTTVILLADALRGYFHLRRGNGVDWLTVAGAGLAAAVTEGDVRAQAAAHLSLADAHQRQSCYEPAAEHYARALELSEQTGWLDGRGVVLGNLGFVCWQAGRLGEAAALIGQALEITRRTGRTIGTAFNLNNLGIVQRQLGNLAAADDIHHAALTLHREIGSRLGQAIALGHLAETHHAIGRLKEAAEDAGEALSILREIGDRGNEAEALRILAAINRDAGELNTALEYARAALALATGTGDRRVEADALNTLATVEQRLFQHTEAIRHHGQVVDLAHEIKTVHQEAEALVELAAAHNYLGHRGDALTCVEQALELARPADFRLIEGQALAVLAEIHATAGDRGRARSLAEQAAAALNHTAHQTRAARALRMVGGTT